MGWGFGVFNCNAGEHLNKRIKCMEFGVTNMGEDRFVSIMRNTRVKQFHYPDQMLRKSQEVVCSACNEIGHRRNNKHCPMHPDNIHFDLSDSDEECI